MKSSIPCIRRHSDSSHKYKSASPSSGELGGTGPSGGTLRPSGDERRSYLKRPSLEGAVDPLLLLSRSHPQDAALVTLGEDQCRVNPHDSNHRTAIIWGVRADTAPWEVLKHIYRTSTFCEVLSRHDIRRHLKHAPRGMHTESGTVTRAYWRGHGQHRHVAIEFSKKLTSATVGVLRQCLKPHPWKAVKGRDFHTRIVHRRKPVQLAPRHQVIPVANTYACLDREDAQQHQESASEQPQPPEEKNSTHKRKLIKLGSLNVNRALSSKIGEYEEYFNKHRYDVIAIQEHGLKKGDKPPAMRGFVAFPQKLDDRTSGVVIYVHSALATFTHALGSSTTNQLWIRIKGVPGRQDLNICSAYMPQESDTKACRQTAFEALEETAVQLNIEGEVVILGDLNAKLGPPTTPQEAAALGKYGEHCPRSGNGSLLAEMLVRAEMISLLGQTPPPASAAGKQGFWYTRQDRRTLVYHQLDYCLVSNNLAREHPKGRVDYTHLNSDHHLVSASLSFPRTPRHKTKQVRRRTFKFDKFVHKSAAEEDVLAVKKAKESYAESLRQTFQGFSPTASYGKVCACVSNCACALVADFVKRTNEALELSIGSKCINRKFTRGWFDKEATQLVSLRRQAYRNWRAQPTANNWLLFRAKRSICNKAIRKKKRDDWFQFLEGFNSDFAGDQRKFWQRVKRLSPDASLGQVAPIKSKEGNLACTEKEIKEAWAQHYEDLGTPNQSTDFDGSFAAEVQQAVKEFSNATGMPESELDVDFTEDELQRGLDGLHFYKASGEDSIKNPALTHGGEVMRGILLQLFNTLLRKETISQDWARAVIVNLYKEGDRTDPGNYRGISLISCLGKLYLSLWAKRLTKFLEDKISCEQGGFRPTRSTIDNALALREILLSRNQQGKKSYCFFIDYRKAFDTVWHDGLWKKLWDMGIRGKAWRIIKTLYANLEAGVRIGDSISRRFRLLQGVRQGCPLSPILFNCYINGLVLELQKLGKGVRVETIQRNIDGLLYADDVILIADSPEDLQAMIDTVDDFNKKWQLTLNLGKSKVMVVSAANQTAGDVPLFYRRSRIEVVDSYKYLGIYFTSNLSWTKHFNYIIDEVKEAEQKLVRLTSSRRICAKAKIVAWTSKVRPLLEYGAEVWRLTGAQIKTLERIQTDFGKRAMKLNQHTSSKGVRALMGTPRIALRHNRARLSYLAKLKTMDNFRLCREICLDSNESRDLSRFVPEMEKFANDTPQLAAARRVVKQAMERNGNILPMGKDESIQVSTDESECNFQPLAFWRHQVRCWMVSAAAADISTAGPSTALIARSYRHFPPNAHSLPAFHLTLRGSAEQNQVRLRLLSGTSSLNTTVRHWMKDRKHCPMGCATDEDATHFLVKCPAYRVAREEFVRGLAEACTCKHLRSLTVGQEASTCVSFFNNLDDDGKALFMLGGPVPVCTTAKPWKVEVEVENLAKQFVTQAWKQRCQRLTDNIQTRQTHSTQRPSGPMDRYLSQAHVTHAFFAHHSAHTTRSVLRSPINLASSSDSGSHSTTSTTECDNT